MQSFNRTTTSSLGPNVKTLNSVTGPGQQVNVDSSLVDPKGNAVAGSQLKVSFKCP